MYKQPQRVLLWTDRALFVLSLSLSLSLFHSLTLTLTLTLSHSLRPSLRLEAVAVIPELTSSLSSVEMGRTRRSRRPSATPSGEGPTPRQTGNTWVQTDKMDAQDHCIALHCVTNVQADNVMECVFNATLLSVFTLTEDTFSSNKKSV